MVEFPAPESAHALAEDCRRCPALVESRTRIAWGNGPRDADLVVVGEAPAAGDPDNREPAAEERANCRSYLVAAGRSLDGGFLDAVLDPVSLPEVGTTLVPVLYPSYEAVWRARLGFDDCEAYLAAVRAALPG
ncbi:MAG: hypothetical protein V5A28_11890 [Haloarculaceae archaeon]